MVDNIHNFFENFTNSNKIVFGKLKETIANEEVALTNSLDNLKKRIQLFLNEEDMIKKKNSKQ
jgi:hypothetical protein